MNPTAGLDVSKERKAAVPARNRSTALKPASIYRRDDVQSFIKIRRFSKLLRGKIILKGWKKKAKDFTTQNTRDLTADRGTYES
jgi:hypothetical protein